MNINKYIVDYFFYVGGGCLLLAAAANAAPPDKIDVCHVPADTPENIQLIQVGANGGALEDHLSHGDWLVSEEMCDTIADNNCDGVAGTQDEDDADCEARLDAGATCVLGECVPAPVLCPCDFDTVPVVLDPNDVWGSSAELQSRANTCDLIGLNGNMPHLHVNVDSASCFIDWSEGAAFATDLTVDEANACAADIEAYATALDDVTGVTVNNVGTPCPEF